MTMLTATGVLAVCQRNRQAVLAEGFVLKGRNVLPAFCRIV